MNDNEKQKGPTPEDLSNREKTGNKIARLRKHKGLTQEQLAEKAKLTRINLSRIETGKYNPGLDILNRIANALDTEWDLTEKASD